MKKKLLLVASALLLVSCGGNNHPVEYVAEPEVKSEMKKTDAVAKMAVLSENVGNAKGIGGTIVGNFKTDVTTKTFKTEDNGLPEDIESKFSIDASDLNASFGLKNFGENVVGSFTESVKFKANVEATNLDFDSAGSLVTKKGSANLDQTITSKAYLEGGYCYMDGNDSIKALKDFAGQLSSAFGASIEIPDVEGKTKVAVPEMDWEQIANINVTFSGAIAGLSALISASISGELLPAMTSASAEKTILDYFTFSEYKNGQFGLTFSAELSTLLDLFGGMVDGGEGASMFSGVQGNIEAVAIFSDTKIESLGFKANISYAMGSKEETGMVMGASANGGAKINFVYDNDVKVESVTDKDSYKEVSPDEGDEGGEEF